MAWLSAPSLLQSKEKLLQMPGRRACILVPKILGTLLMGGGVPVASCSVKQQLPYASCGGKSFFKSLLVAVWLDGTGSKSNIPR